MTKTSMRTKGETGKTRGEAERTNTTPKLMRKTTKKLTPLMGTMTKMI